MGQAAFSTKVRALICCITLMLASCATVPPPSMSVDEIASFKLTGVEVHGVDVIRSWPAEEKRFLATNSDPEIARRLPDESAQNFPAVQAYFQATLQRTFKAQFDNQIAPVMSGSRPVKAIITLGQFDVPSVARRVFIDQYAKIRATIELTDAKTNASLLTYAGPYRQQWMVGGLGAAVVSSFTREDDPENALIANYVSAYRDWLITR